MDFVRARVIPSPCGTRRRADAESKPCAEPVEAGETCQTRGGKSSRQVHTYTGKHGRRQSAWTSYISTGDSISVRDASPRGRGSKPCAEPVEAGETCQARGGKSSRQVHTYTGKHGRRQSAWTSYISTGDSIPVRDSQCKVVGTHK